MTYNAGKLIAAAILAVVLVVAIVIDDTNGDWAVPLLGLLVGYVIGNAQVTSGEGSTAPIASKLPPPPPEA